MRKIKRGQTIYAVLMLVLIISLCVLLYSDVLVVRRIQVLGNERFTKEEIWSLSGLTLDESMFRADLDGARTRIEQNPYLRINSIRRSWPDTVVITVQERAESATVRYLEHYIVVDETGLILSIRDQAIDSLPVVEGISVSSFQLGQAIGSSDPLQTHTMQLILSALREHDLSKWIDTIHLQNPTLVTMTAREGMKIVVGSTDNLTRKMIWTKEVFADLRQSGKLTGTLDVTNEDTASYTP